MNKAKVVSINMGYGHQRTAFALKGLVPEGKIINANDYPGMPKTDRAIWERTRKFYEFISSFKKTLLIGNFAFSVFDAFQKIFSFYPKRDLSRSNFTLRNIYSLLKGGWGRDLIERLGREQLPLITTFFTPAFMADFFNYPGKVFCVICDVDISRTWAPLEPEYSKIKYFAPTTRVVERLKQYKVKPENIFLTGYPLPLENIGGIKLEILKTDLRYRILNLDPQKKYFKNYNVLVEKKLGKLPKASDHPLTIMFAVGGAGAQKEIGIEVIKSLIKKIKSGKIKIILVAGIKEKVNEYFKKNIEKLGLKKYIQKNIDPRIKRGQDAEGARVNEVSPHCGVGVEIIFAEEIENYFQDFNSALRKTDILWTKPSELSFYSALGLPIIIAPPIGSQEEFNMRWLLKSGFGTLQENPAYTNEWLFDWIEKGYLAEFAMQGFIEGEKLGTYNIKKICLG